MSHHLCPPILNLQTQRVHCTSKTSILFEYYVGYELSEVGEDTTPPKDFRIEASFEGIDFTISSSTQDIIHSVVKGNNNLS